MFTEDEFTNLTKSYMDTVFRLALNYMKCPSLADDITQNVFIKLYRCNKTFENEAHVKFWLIRVTINECKKALLSPWRRMESLDYYCETIAFPTDEHSDLFRLVMELPKKYRVAIYLHYYEGYSTAEMSHILGIPGATVRTHLKRGRELLKTKWEGKENV